MILESGSEGVVSVLLKSSSGATIFVSASWTLRDLVPLGSGCPKEWNSISKLLSAMNFGVDLVLVGDISVKDEWSGVY